MIKSILVSFEISGMTSRGIQRCESSASDPKKWPPELSNFKTGISGRKKRKKEKEEKRSAAVGLEPTIF